MPQKRNVIELEVHPDLKPLNKGQLKKELAAMRKHFKAALYPNVVDITISVSGKPKAWERMRIIIDMKG